MLVAEDLLVFVHDAIVGNNPVSVVLMMVPVVDVLNNEANFVHAYVNARVVDCVFVLDPDYIILVD